MDNCCQPIEGDRRWPTVNDRHCPSTIVIVHQSMTVAISQPSSTTDRRSTTLLVILNSAMRVTALVILNSAASSSSSPEAADPVVLANATDVSRFGYFQRFAAREFILFVARTVAKRTPPGQRQSVQHEEYKVHSYNRNDLCALAFMDDHYPARSAFSLLNQILDEYQKAFGESWRDVKVDATQPWPYLTEALTKFQDPAEVDKLFKIQRDLDETKIILHKTIDSLLDRGVKLDTI